MPTTHRSDVAFGLWTLGNVFVTNNPTMLKRFYRRRPAAFADAPLGYVGARDEDLVHTSGIRRRSFEPTIVLVQPPTGDYQESEDRMDDLVDAFLDHLTLYPYAVSSNTVTEPIRVRDAEETTGEGGAVYPAAVITLRSVIQEGRP